MTVKNGKIIECTDNELFKHYLKCKWDDIYSYSEYKRLCIEEGTKVQEQKHSLILKESNYVDR